MEALEAAFDICEIGRCELGDVQLGLGVVLCGKFNLLLGAFLTVYFDLGWGGVSPEKGLLYSVSPMFAGMSGYSSNAVLRDRGEIALLDWQSLGEINDLPMQMD